MARYTFGDEDAAVRRLAMVAQAYEPVSRSFLERHAPSRAGLAVDLGCGPGFSTRLLSLVCRPRELHGLDSSADFLTFARSRLAQAQFFEHDVTDMPLPNAPVDLLYARLVLAHLSEPMTIVEQWRQQLAPGGALLVEELEDVDAPAGPLREYEDISTAIVRHGGGVMYAGRVLESLGGERVPVTVDSRTAAAIYLFNTRRWLARPPPGMPKEQLNDLERDLVRLVEEPEGRSLSWIVRQIAIPAPR